MIQKQQLIVIFTCNIFYRLLYTWKASANFFLQSIKIPRHLWRGRNLVV